MWRRFGIYLKKLADWLDEVRPDHSRKRLVNIASCLSLDGSGGNNENS